jgi:carboxyl-terminal processing protease
MKKMISPLTSVLILFFSLSCSHQVKKSEPENAKIDLKTMMDPNVLFEKFWDTSKTNIYPKELETKYFTDLEYGKLKKQAQRSHDIYNFSIHLNKFLNKFGVSHTKFYTDKDYEFYFFRSLFTTRNPDQPTIWNIGAEFEKNQKGYIVRSVLDGLAAESTGLRRGDIIKEINGKAFNPVFYYKPTPSNQADLLVQRGSREIQLAITPVKSGLHRTYIQAIKNSIKTIPIKGKLIGYVHLWTGTHDDSAKELQNAVHQLKNTDALVLDLRDGYGGAWWSHLDPFFKSTNDYFKATWLDRDGKTTDMLPEKKQNPQAYTKPMVVLINEGVRSGKEALAYQFKKTKRATLVGTKTAGFFVGGGAYFTEIELPYFLYLSSKGLLLDGINLEGNGVKPDIKVSYPLTTSSRMDPQLAEALKILSQEN